MYSPKKRSLFVSTSVSIALLLAFTLTFPAFAQQPNGYTDQYNEMTVTQLEAQMKAGTLTSEQLTKAYIGRIIALDQGGPGVNAVIELNPDALNMARYADKLFRNGIVLGPMQGIPVLLKANVDTGDQMQTSAGSFALIGKPALQDSTVAGKLRDGGAVILGKTNLSEWANFRSFESVSGWSGVGGQTNNPYGIARNPCGSSAGSGAGVSANFSAVSFGTETDGSIVCPANANGVVGIKPTVGLTSRGGIVPISHTQDTFGPHGRYVADAAVALGVVQSLTCDPRDQATCGVPLGWQGRYPRPSNIPTDYTQFLNKRGLQGARLGVTRVGLTGFDPFVPTPQNILDQFENAITAIQNAGATVIDLDAAGFTFPSAPNELLVLCFDFRNDVKSYLSTRGGVPAAHKDLSALISFDNSHAKEEMPFFNQDLFELCNSLAPGPDDPQPAFGGVTYNQALAQDQNLGVNGIDLALSQFSLDAIVTATDNPAWATDLIYGDHFIYGSSGLAAPEGYPIVQVPAGMVFGAPMGISFFGTAFSEPKLITLASGFEAVTKIRKNNVPTFAQTVPNYSIAGSTLQSPQARRVPKGSHSQQPQQKLAGQTVETRRPHHL
ncbi:MAG: amidase family protein [Terriglobales bacterium]